MAIQAYGPRRVVTPEGERSAAIIVEGEKIREVAPLDPLSPARG